MTNLSCNACSCVHNDDNCCCLNGIDVKCAAHNCVYNNNEACQADHVDISGITAVNADDTVCSTFKSK